MMHSCVSPFSSMQSFSEARYRSIPCVCLRLRELSACCGGAPPEGTELTPASPGRTALALTAASMAAEGVAVRDWLEGPWKLAAMHCSTWASRDTVLPSGPFEGSSSWQTGHSSSSGICRRGGCMDGGYGGVVVSTKGLYRIGCCEFDDVLEDRLGLMWWEKCGNAADGCDWYAGNGDAPGLGREPFGGGGGGGKRSDTEERFRKVTLELRKGSVER